MRGLPSVAPSLLPVPLTAPKGVKCRALSSTSLRVEWRAMGELELRGPLVQYNIYYQRTASNEPQRASSGGDKQGKAQFDNKQYRAEVTESERRMSHRKRRESKQQLS